MNIKNFWGRLKRLPAWFWEGKFFWFFLFLILILIPFKSLYAYFGAGLQFIGVFIIVIGINNKIRFYKGENPIVHHWSYFKRFPFLKAKYHLAALSGSSNISFSASAKLSVEYRKPDESLRDIIRYINEELPQIKKQIFDTRSEINNTKISFNKQLEELSHRIELNLNKVDNKIEVSNTSSIGLELFGAGCIGAGLIYSILPLIVTLC